MNSQYETLYGVGLLDDLHNYFPAVLYQPLSFQNVGDLLQYIQSQSRNRFDLFSMGHREYQMRTATAPAPVPVPVSVSVSVSASSLPDPVPYSSVHTPFASRNSTLSAASSPQTPPLRSYRERSPPPIVRTRPNNRSLEYIFSMPDLEDDTPLTSRLLLSLLSLPILQNTNVPAPTMDAFLQPILVRPTEEQITANTTLGTLQLTPNDTEEYPCAICQDTLQPDQEGRRLNACHHWFHRTCIDTWFQTNVHCPVCRHDIRDQV